MKKISYIIILLACVSCAVLPEKNDFYITDSTIALGVVGEKRKSLRKTDFQAFGLPEYKEKIKVNVSEKAFNENTFKDYTTSVKNRNIVTAITLVDSLSNKPTFIQLKIEDKVAVVKALNTENIDIFNYLKKSPSATLVSEIRLVGNEDFKTKLKQADAYYIKTDKHKKTWLVLHKEEKEIDKLDLLQTTIFEYKLSSFCWKASKRRKIELATILNEGQNCSESTNRNANDLEEDLTKNSFKF